MTNAKRDNNRNPTLLGVSNSDGNTTSKVLVDPSTHQMKVTDGTTGTNAGGSRSSRDSNGQTALIATSTDGITPVSLYIDSTGGILVKST